MKYKYNAIKNNLLFVICVVFLFCLFFGRVCYIALSPKVDGIDLVSFAESKSYTTKLLTAERGTIYDATGDVVFAQNVNSYTVIAYLSDSRTTDKNYPKHVVDKETTAKKLAEVLEPINAKMTYEYILMLLNTKAYQVELGPGGRNITENVKQRIEALLLPGIDFIRTSKRYYPNGDFASYIIGYAKKREGSEEIIGELGIESYCDRYLKGTDGSITYQKDGNGYQMVDKISYETPALDGYNVYLTIDQQVQIFLDNAVDKFNEYDPSWVTITIADAKTGAIIGSSSNPSFNPNKLNISDYKNPMVSYTYEPGSTMKIFSFMSAIEENKYTGDKEYKSGKINVADYSISDWNKKGWGNITFDRGFTYSSNVAAVLLAQGVGKKQLLSYYNDLGFANKTGIELANEYGGTLKVEYETELATVSYGQGMTVTPIQMVKALTVLTNDGTVLKPYVIDKIEDPNTGEIVYQGGRKEVEKIYSTSTVNKIVELMDLTVNAADPVATGKVYSTPAVRLIGKTGTANYVDSSGKYVKGSYNNIRSFAGVFPKENPEYIIYVAVKDHHGSSKQMGNIIKELVESVAKYKNLDERPSDKDASKIVTIDKFSNKSVISSVSKLNSNNITSVVIGDGDTVVKQYPKPGVTTSVNNKVFLVTNGLNLIMPDITGWSSGEVISLFDLLGVDYQLNGYGYVESTNVLPGAIINLGETIVVNLKNIEPESLTFEMEDLEDDKEKGNN